MNYPLCVEGAVELETVGFAKDMFAFILNKKEKIDAVLTGFIPSVELVSETKTFCIEQKSNGSLIFVDPVFGDNGKAYKSVKPENIEALRDLLFVADYCFPNYTEACLLTGVVYDDSGMTAQDAKDLLLKLKAFGAKNPIITGCIVNNKDVIVFLDENDELCVVEYERFNGHLVGTGDRFAAGVTGRLCDGVNLEKSIRETAVEISEKARGIER